MHDPRYLVDVSVVTRYLPEQSQPEHQRFAFAYTITVRNSGNLPAGGALFRDALPAGTT